MVWKKPEESAPKREKVTISAGKVMAIVFWDCKGVLLVDYLPPNTTVNAAKYCEALTKLRAAIKRKHPGLLSRKVLLVHDNARPHAVRTTQTLLESFKWVIFPHPPYSLDLTPSDFHLFPALKLHLGGKHFANDDEVQAEANHWLRRQDTAWYNSGIKKLLQRYQICLDRNGGAPTCHTEAGAARDGPIGIESSHAVFTLILLLDVLDQKLMFLPLVVEFESVGNIDDLVPFLPGDIGAWIAYDLALKNSCTSSWNPKTSLKPQDPVISTHSEQFIDRLDNNTLTILNGRTRGDRSGNYTYNSARGSSVVDYCIVSHGLLGYVHDLYIEGLPHSDHLPLIIKMDMSWGPKQVTNPTSRVKKKYIWLPERVTLFVEDLGGAYGFWNNSIENIMNNMVNQIKSAMVQNGMQIEIKANNSLSKPWFDHECYIAKKIMKATLTKYIKSNKDLDRLEYVKTRNKYTSIINNKKKKYFCEIQEKLNNTYDSSEFWKTIALFRKRNYTQGNISISDWQQFYNKLLDTESIPDYEPVTMTFLNTDNELTKCITLNEISKEISRIRHGKAAGFDDIMNEAIKALPKDYLISLKDIFNRILRTSEFPTTWLKSVIQPIFKNGDPDDPSNYRGIALLSNIAKLFTSILKSRLGSWIEKRNIVPENQAGFRAGHSCQVHIFTLLSLIQMTLSRKRRKCYMFFVDLKKAFDTVPHSLLWRKLVDAGLNHRFVNLIKDYYTNMTAVVRWNNSFTAPIKVRSGVLQGEPMSPYLFILFINDLIGLYNNSDLPGIYLPNYGYVHILLYADDIVLIGESKNNLQIKINMLRKYFETNLLTLNENKSKIVVFRNGGRLAQNDKWFWGERQLSVTTKYLYLGYPLTSANSLNKVASHYKGKALAAIGAVWQVLTKSKMNSLNAAMRLLDSTVLPYMLYAAPCWALNQVKVVDQVQNIFLRRNLNLPKYTPGFMLRMECGQVSQEVTIIKQVLRFWVRIMKMEESRLPRACLSHLWTLHSNQRAGLTFIENLSTILDSNGFSFLKGCPDYTAILTEIPAIIRIATEQSIQSDMAKILNTSHYSHFKYLKNSITAERYLFTTIPLAIKRFFAQLRLLCTIFPENRSKRWKIDLTLTCDLCKNRIQDKIMHIIFGGSCLEKQRKEILGDLPWSQPDCQQICSWMNTLMVDQGLSLGLYKFYKAAVNVRWRIMDSPNVVVCLEEEGED
ncbi:hypothetical protein LAZ67_11002260 [Cordylochernes scorpioides]|uniref:Reverse transcriptase domain-containing protein n=1 Tax=Cordylochernes scorpioides TaxID=51811 RepID=A0ABY6KZ48_9ARAC|nr:hypothetical protein LAZ67_11002260 [Cordylochernes scorpioides]